MISPGLVCKPLSRTLYRLGSQQVTLCAHDAHLSANQLVEMLPSCDAMLKEDATQ